MIQLLTLLSLALLTGCVSTLGPGRFSPRVVEATAEPGAHEFELELAADGAVTKVAVEHATADRAPAVIRDLAMATYPGATLTGYEEEFVAGVGRVLEVEVRTADGRECEVSSTEAGALRYTECQVPAAQVPAGVMEAVRRALPGGPHDVAEAELLEGPTFNEYRVELRGSGRTYYVRVALDGTVLARSVKLEAEVSVPLK